MVAPDAGVVEMMKLLACVSAVLLAPLQAPAQKRPPIIDMHLHAFSLSDFGVLVPNCADPRQIEYPGVDPREPITFDRVTACPSRLPAAASDEALMKESLARLERYNIWAVTSGQLGELDRVSAWRAAAPHRIIPAVSFSRRDRTPDELRRLVA
jgi:uncharacterized protein